jgi:hypothetical protein
MILETLLKITSIAKHSIDDHGTKLKHGAKELNG